MAELDFPNTPQTGDQYTGNNGITYIFDGYKWVGHPPGLEPGTSALVNSGNTAQIDASGNLVLPNYTLPVTAGSAGQTLVWPNSGSVLEWATGSGGGGSSYELVRNSTTLGIDTSGNININNTSSNQVIIKGENGQPIDLKSSVWAELWYDRIWSPPDPGEGDPGFNIPPSNEATDSYVWTDQNGVHVEVNRGTGGLDADDFDHTWLFGTDGKLQLPIVASGDTAIGTAFNTNPPGHTLTLGHNGGVNGGSGGELKFDYGTAEIKVIKDAGITQTWTFDSNGYLTLPTGGKLGPQGMGWTGLSGGTNGMPVSIVTQDENGTWLSGLTTWSNGTNTGIVSIGAYDIGAQKYNDWVFNPNGNLQIPGTVPVSYTPSQYTTVASTATNAVVFDYSINNRTAKVLIQVEGLADSTGRWDTQSCEMMIAISYRTDYTPIASVYGLVHTSTLPIATFDAQYNSTTNRIEIVCTKTAAVQPNNELFVVVVGTTISTSD